MKWEDPIVRDVLFTKAREKLGTVSASNLKCPVSQKELLAFCEEMVPILEELTKELCTPGAVKNQLDWAVDTQKAKDLKRSHIKTRALNKDAAIRVGYIRG